MNTNLLKARLADFGLDPREWRLEIIRRSGGLLQVLIRNCDDQELVFSGWTDRQSWLNLSYYG